MTLATPEGYVLVTEWDGDVFEKLEAVCAKFDDMGPMLRAIGHWAQVQFQKNILSSTDVYGAPFAPLKKPRSRGHNPATKPLFDSGRLFEDIGFQEDTADNSVIVGNSQAVPYALFQNDGTSFIPAREYLGVPEYAMPPFFQQMGRYFLPDAPDAEALAAEAI